MEAGEGARDDGAASQPFGDFRHVHPDAADHALSISSDEVDASLSPAHWMALQEAFVLIERRHFAARLADYAGQPVERLISMMPKQASAQVNRAIEAAMLRCLELAISSIDPRAEHRPATHLPSLLAGLNGGISGFFGPAALPIELPLTTTLMLRTIADTARHHGEDLCRLEARLACVEVFALGARSPGKRMDMGYYASRALLGKLAGDAWANLVERSIARTAAPAVSRLLTEVASRFGMIVSERFAASAFPVLGAVGGATVNFVFMNHFQRVAHGHFTIRRLERIYGPAIVRRHYEMLFSK